MIIVLCVTFGIAWCDKEKEQKQAFTVKFVTNGGSAVDEQIVEKGHKATVPTTTQMGYTLDGWYNDVVMTQKYVFETPVTADLTLYAKWTPNEAGTFTVTFNSNGGSEVTAQNVISGDKVNEQIPAPYLFNQRCHRRIQHNLHSHLR